MPPAGEITASACQQVRKEERMPSSTLVSLNSIPEELLIMPPAEAGDDLSPDRSEEMRALFPQALRTRRVCSESPAGAIGRSQWRQPLDWGPSPESIPLAAATSGFAGGCGGEAHTKGWGGSLGGSPGADAPGYVLPPPSGASGTDASAREQDVVIGKPLGISRQRVDQILRKAERKLKSILLSLAEGDEQGFVRPIHHNKD